VSVYTEITNETVTELAKAVNTSQGYTVGLGLQGINLDGPAKSLFPVLSPFRNRVPRVQAPVGARASQWRAITQINVQNQDIFTDWGQAGGLVTTNEQDYAAPYRPISLGDSVHWDAEQLARGFDELRASAGIRLLYATMIKEDQALLGASNIALTTPSSPVLTPASTGGSIPAGTAVSVTVSARTLGNYFNGGGTVLSPATVANTAAGTATNSVAATVAPVRGAVAYDWFVAGFYYATTTAPLTVVTAVPTANSPLSSLPAIGGAVPTVASRAADTSANPNAFAGLLTQLYADYSTVGTGQVQAGTGTPSGAQFVYLNGATLTGSNGGITEIDNVLQNLWDFSRISPTVMLCASQQARDITRKVISTGGAYTLFAPNDVEARQNVVGNYMLTTYINPAVNGQPIEILVMPNLPAGTIILLSERLPYPSTNVPNVIDVETQMEYTQIEYAMNRGTPLTNNSGPRYDFEVRAIETLRVYFPAGCAVIQGIAAG
jgi:hypothetical protein